MLSNVGDDAPLPARTISSQVVRISRFSASHSGWTPSPVPGASGVRVASARPWRRGVAAVPHDGQVLVCLGTRSPSPGSTDCGTSRFVGTPTVTLWPMPLLEEVAETSCRQTSLPGGVSGRASAQSCSRRRRSARWRRALERSPRAQVAAPPDGRCPDPGKPHRHECHEPPRREPRAPVVVSVGNAVEVRIAWA